MTKAEKGSFQHFLSNHGKELGLPSFKGKQADAIMNQPNHVIAYIKTNAQSIRAEANWIYGVKGSGKRLQI